MSDGLGFFSWLELGRGSKGLNPDDPGDSSNLLTEREDEGLDVAGEAEVGILEGAGIEGEERGSRIPP